MNNQDIINDFAEMLFEIEYLIFIEGNYLKEYESMNLYKRNWVYITNHIKRNYNNVIIDEIQKLRKDETFINTMFDDLANYIEKKQGSFYVSKNILLNNSNKLFKSVLYKMYRYSIDSEDKLYYDLDGCYIET